MLCRADKLKDVELSPLSQLLKVFADNSARHGFHSCKVEFTMQGGGNFSSPCRYKT